MKIAFCSSEVFPFAKTGGLADVCGALPIALEELGEEIVIFLPFYRSIEVQKTAIQREDDLMPWAVYGKNIKVYFIENEDYFERDGLYGDVSGDYPDNLERFTYYSLQSLEALKKIKFKPDLIHCHDWQTALIPVALKETYKNDSFFKGVKVLFTIHNLAFQGDFSKDAALRANLPENLFHNRRLEHNGNINLLKAAISYSDAISTVSEQYAKEIQTKEFGFGLEESLAARHDEISGIVNGIDYRIWDPETDLFIDEKYSIKNYRQRKKINKINLKKNLGFSNPGSSDYPLFGFVGRLSHQKGLDLIINALDDLMPLDLQIVIQGVGEEKYYDQLRCMLHKYPQELRLFFEFDEKIAHQIYAGCDFFLMPSAFEPCGLSQLISLRYGTIPIVYKTGGLVDTIIPFNDKTLMGNGFIFDRYTNKCFFNEIKRALRIFQKKEHFYQLIENALKVDFSWTKSAKEYQDLYKKLIIMKHSHSHEE